MLGLMKALSIAFWRNGKPLVTQSWPASWFSLLILLVVLTTHNSVLYEQICCSKWLERFGSPQLGNLACRFGAWGIKHDSPGNPRKPVDSRQLHVKDPVSLCCIHKYVNHNLLLKWKLWWNCIVLIHQCIWLLSIGRIITWILLFLL